MIDPAAANLVTLAESIARHAHAGQRYGELPYVSHLQDVVEVLRSVAPASNVLIAAGWLHDVIEDTPETPVSLFSKGIPPKVVALVDACTDGTGANRRERKERPFAMIPATPDAILVKLADRIANVESAIRHGKADLLAMYRKEHAVFRARLHGAPTTLDAEPLWERLERAIAGGETGR